MYETPRSVVKNARKLLLPASMVIKTCMHANSDTYFLTKRPGHTRHKDSYFSVLCDYLSKSLTDCKNYFSIWFFASIRIHFKSICYNDSIVLVEKDSENLYVWRRHSSSNLQYRTDAGQAGCRTGQMQDSTDAEQIRCVTGRMQDGSRKCQMQDRSDKGQDGCRTGWMQDRTDAVHAGQVRCETERIQNRSDAV